MIRFLLILALAFGIYWCYNNLNLSSTMSSIGSSVKNEKTIKAVNQGRADINSDVEDAMNE